MSYDITVNISTKADSSGFNISVQNTTTTPQSSTTTTVTESSEIISVAVLTELLTRATESG